MAGNKGGLPSILEGVIARCRQALPLPTMLRTALLAIFFAVLIWSAIHPHDYFTWFMEVFPAIIGIALIAATRRRFPLTPLLLVLLTLHAIILMAGGHYTYAEVPLGFWMERAFHLAR